MAGPTKKRGAGVERIRRLMKQHSTVERHLTRRFHGDLPLESAGSTCCLRVTGTRYRCLIDTLFVRRI